MILYLKTHAGLDVKLASGKVISLKGNGVLNNVSESEFKEIAQNRVCVDMLEKGFLVANEKQTERVADDLKNETMEKQAKEKNPKVKVEKAEK